MCSLVALISKVYQLGEKKIYLAKINGASIWHCTTTLSGPQIMSVCMKGKAHSKIRSKVYTP